MKPCNRLFFELLLELFTLWYGVSSLPNVKVPVPRNISNLSDVLSLTNNRRLNLCKFLEYSVKSRRPSETSEFELKLKLDLTSWQECKVEFARIGLQARSFFPSNQIHLAANPIVYDPLETRTVSSIHALVYSADFIRNSGIRRNPRLQRNANGSRLYRSRHYIGFPPFVFFISLNNQ